MQGGGDSGPGAGPSIWVAEGGLLPHSETITLCLADRLPDFTAGLWGAYCRALACSLRGEQLGRWVANASLSLFLFQGIG